MNAGRQAAINLRIRLEFESGREKMEQPLFERMDTVFLRVRDFEQAFAWYHHTLGLPVIWRTDMIAALRAGDKTPITLVKQDAVAEPHPLFNLYTSNIQQTYERMQERGIAVGPLRDYGTVQTFDFTDAEGNVLNVCHFE
ncbi:VOC family protein [Xylanibacillus composti]|nr:VOC family protein [Xylanibacillus composti]